MWWITTAHAELPWDCPTVTTPAEASLYREGDAGAADALDGLEALAMAYWDEACAWEYTSEDDTYTEVTTATCVTGAYTIAYTTGSYTDFYGSSAWTSLNLYVAEGEGWTHLTLETSEWAASNGGDGAEYARAASWEGEIAGFPTDGFLRYSESTTTRYTNTRSVFVEAPGCGVRMSRADATEVIDESVSFTPGAVVDVHRRLDATVCEEFTAYAVVGGAVWGAVLAEDWTDDPADGDRDGYTATCDCDDADPARNAYAVETVDDGIDQDCDGLDRVTEDTGDPADTGGSEDTSEGDPTEGPGVASGADCGCGTRNELGWLWIVGVVALARRGGLGAHGG